MGLYINHDNHNGIFKNNGEINEPNQRLFIRNHVAEMIKEQQKVNDSLHHAFLGLKVLHEQQDHKQTIQWREISSQINKLKEMNAQHEKLEGHVMEELMKLGDENRKLYAIMEDERLSEQEFINQINNMTESHQQIAERLGEYGIANEQLAFKMNKHLELQQQMSEKISKQEDSQEEVLNRLENQEALTEKVIRQIDNFRSILFERTSYLAEKIEDGYQLTSSYVTKLMTGSDKPVTLFMMNRKKGEDSD